MLQIEVKHALKTAEVNSGFNNLILISIFYLIVEVGVLGVMQDCGTGWRGEDWASRLAVDALNKQQ